MPKNTTSESSRTEGTGRSIIFSNSDTFPLNVWVPAVGQMVSIDDVVLSVLQSQSNQFVGIRVQVMRGGSWRDFFPLVVGSQASKTNSHNFGGRVVSDKGDGTNPVVRLNKLGGSSNFNGLIAMTGRLL